MSFILFLSMTLFANTDYDVSTTIWQQSSAEYKALCLQAFNIAKLHLDKVLQTKHSKPYAISIDVDETVFSHSDFNGYLVKNNKTFNEKDWLDWWKSQKMKPIWGVYDFLKYAYSKGVTIFYITNMKKNVAPYALKKLKSLGFPNADNAHFLPRIYTKNKKARRDLVRKNYEIVEYIGDQLTDMPGFVASTVKEREQEVKKAKDKFGTKFILLPNVVYGKWKHAVKIDKASIRTWK